MTQPSEDYLVENLQPVSFTKLRVDGPLTIYQALVPDLAKTGTVFSLTATTASPIDSAAEIALLKSLNEIRAAFLVLDEPDPPYPVPPEPGSFDPETEVMIEPGVAKPIPEGPVNFAVAVQATVPAGQQTTDRKGQDQSWHTKSGQAWATVRVTGGAGTIKPPAKLIPDPQNRHKRTSNVHAPNSYETRSDTVTLHTDTQMIYILYGNSFTLP